VRIVAKVPINDPKHWRERAEEARTVADELTDPDSKRRMLRIADDYEELAKRAEKRLAARNDNQE
jgi:predicted Rossmann-fold nucleotide-binding protein